MGWSRRSKDYDHNLQGSKFKIKDVCQGNSWMIGAVNKNKKGANFTTV
jgi:hypothetical protein